MLCDVVLISGIMYRLFLLGWVWLLLVVGFVVVGWLVEGWGCFCCV